MHVPALTTASSASSSSTISREGPKVSVIIANRDNARFLPACLASVSRQTLSEIEIIVVDDASEDDSCVLVESVIANDKRVTLLRLEQQEGVAQARNRALDACRGHWVAVVDSDDVIHPERLACLVRTAEDNNADMVADNQILFQNGGGKGASRLLEGLAGKRPFRVSAVDYVKSNSFDNRNMPLGYLKPLFRRSFIEKGRTRYRRELLIGEDYDFSLQLLLRGAVFFVVPNLGYFYRRHSASTSHRLSRQALVSMLEVDQNILQCPSSIDDPGLRAAFKYRLQSIRIVLSYTGIVEKIKARDWLGTAGMLASSPRAALLLRNVIRDRMRRLLTRRQPSLAHQRRACVLSRQRVTGATNGSSAYLLGICEALRQDGWTVDLICPSPTMFGRWPVMRLLAEMSVFQTTRIRGAFRAGSIVVAVNPVIAVRAVLALADRALKTVGLGLGVLARKAPHAIAVPLTETDRLFVAAHARRPSLVIADYAFLTDAIPYTMSPDAKSIVIMHDLFSGQRTPGRPVIIDLEEEMRLLGQADLVVAIQKQEADIVAAHLGADRVLVVPMAASRVEVAEPGDGCTVMFVGSNTLPNSEAVDWLTAEIWPLVAAACPGARLLVVGSVSQSVRSKRGDVEMLGRVDSLTPYYHCASVVVSPLRSGSGLKVKLVEAMARGKAFVGTSVTFQGVEHLANTAAICADEAQSFAEAIIALLASRDDRRNWGDRALTAAAREFSPAQAHAPLLDFARGHGPGHRACSARASNACGSPSVGVATTP